MKKLVLSILIFVSFLYSKERLVVLDPAAVEIIYMLNAQDQIKAIASLKHSNIYPQEETSKLDSVGTFSNPSLEKIVSLKPSLVILSSYSLGLKENLDKLNIKSIYLKAQNLDDIKENVKVLSKIVSKEKEGKALIQKYEKDLEKLRENKTNKRGIFLYSSNPLMAFSKDSVIYDIFEILGIKNLELDTNIKKPIISNEFILKNNPDIIILGISANNINDLIKLNPFIKYTNAYKNNQIYFYKNTHILLRLSPMITKRIQDFKDDIKLK